jgi:hypothetical protein
MDRRSSSAKLTVKFLGLELDESDLNAVMDYARKHYVDHGLPNAAASLVAGLDRLLVSKGFETLVKQNDLEKLYEL